MFFSSPFFPAVSSREGVKQEPERSRTAEAWSAFTSQDEKSLTKLSYNRGIHWSDREHSRLL